MNVDALAQFRQDADSISPTPLGCDTFTIRQRIRILIELLSRSQALHNGLDSPRPVRTRAVAHSSPNCASYLEGGASGLRFCGMGKWAFDCMDWQLWSLGTLSAVSCSTRECGLPEPAPDDPNNDNTRRNFIFNNARVELIKLALAIHARPHE